MSRRPVVLLPLALQDLAGIRDYIRKDAPDRAKAFIDSIHAALARLADLPRSGSRPKDEGLAERGYRVVVIGDYMAFYIEAKSRVEVHRVLHGKRRYGHLI